MKFNTLLHLTKRLITFSAALLLASLPHLLWSQCATFGAFDIGEDAEITCEDSCLTLVSPSIATVASGGTEYEVEEIEYALPYPFNQGSVAINTGDDVYSSIIPLGFTFEFSEQLHPRPVRATVGSHLRCETAGYNPVNQLQPEPLNNSVMGIYSDLNPHVATSGTTPRDAPCREFVVTWNAVCEFSHEPAASAEVVLYEGTNVIEVSWQPSAT